ncbi:MAG: 16S rRNA (uracil(1498)-N(3))-methyltransferase [Desulfovibrio sp.]|nr:16S rRNA (uracil(1498)-N(3))-methyltransferase [Desulfovibrio sp.]
MPTEHQHQSLHHFYLAPDKWGESVTLDESESNHLARVLRLREHETVALLDGSGRTGVFEITGITKKYCTLKRLGEERQPEPVSKAVMALALSKAVRRGFFMEKAVELGAHAVWLFQGETSQGKIAADMAEGFRRQMIAGAKQCRNPWIPEIRLFPKGLRELLPAVDDIPNRILPWELQGQESMIRPGHLGKAGKTIYVIGPEGGFSDAELALLDTWHFQRVSLGPRVLRCETAAVLTLGLHYWASHLS